VAGTPSAIHGAVLRPDVGESTGALQHETKERGLWSNRRTGRIGLRKALPAVFCRSHIDAIIQEENIRENRE